MLAYFLALPIIEAFRYRWRGMAHSWGDTVNRLMWAIPTGFNVGLISYEWNQPWWLGLVAIPLAFLAVCIGHASEQSNNEDEYVKMAGVLMGMYVLSLLPLLVMMPLFVLSAFLCAFLTFWACWLGYHRQFSLKLFGIQWTVTGDNSQCEEFYIGLLAFGVPLAIIGGLGSW